MVQLQILSGKMAGENIFVRRFPFQIGRAAQNGLQLDDDGIWDEHLKIEFQKKEGFTLLTANGAFAAVNEQPQNAARLRNGDIISFGSAKIQFWLAPARQKKMFMRELFIWLLLAAVTIFQIALLNRVLKFQ